MKSLPEELTLASLDACGDARVTVRVGASEHVHALSLLSIASMSSTVSPALPPASPFRPPASKRGYTLIEMLVVAAVLLILINVCMALFVNASRVSAYTAAAVDRADGLSELEDEFVALVRASAGVVERYAAYETNDKQVVLRLNSHPGDSAFRVIGPLNDPAKLVWMDFQNGEVADMGAWRVPLVSARFSYPHDAQLVQLDVTPARETKNAAKSEVVRRIVATPRGQMMRHGS